MKNVQTSHSIFQSGKRFFGANLNTLVNDDRKIPVVIDKLFATIEVHALYVEGIYRKSAAIAQVRNARNSIENSSSKNITIQNYSFKKEFTFKSYFSHFNNYIINYIINIFPEKRKKFIYYSTID